MHQTQSLLQIHFSQVSMALTMPTTRSLCEARGTVCYITTASDLFIGSGYKHQKKQVCVCYVARPAATSSCLTIAFSPSFSSSCFLHVRLSLPVITTPTTPFMSSVSPTAPQPSDRLAYRPTRWLGAARRNKNGASPETRVPWHRVANRLNQARGSTCRHRGVQQFRR